MEERKHPSRVDPCHASAQQRAKLTPIKRGQIDQLSTISEVLVDAEPVERDRAVHPPTRVELKPDRLTGTRAGDLLDLEKRGLLKMEQQGRAFVFRPAPNLQDRVRKGR